MTFLDGFRKEFNLADDVAIRVKNLPLVVDLLALDGIEVVTLRELGNGIAVFIDDFALLVNLEALKL